MEILVCKPEFISDKRLFPRVISKKRRHFMALVIAALRKTRDIRSPYKAEVICLITVVFFISYINYNNNLPGLLNPVTTSLPKSASS